MTSTPSQGYHVERICEITQPIIDMLVSFGLNVETPYRGWVHGDYIVVPNNYAFYITPNGIAVYTYHPGATSYMCYLDLQDPSTDIEAYFKKLLT